MKKVTIIFGNITFNDSTNKRLVDDELVLFKTNNDTKALIHSIDKIVECENVDTVINKIIDEFETESWLIPSQYNGEIIFEPKPNKSIVDIITEYKIDIVKNNIITEDMINTTCESPELMLIGLLNGELSLDAMRQRIIEESEEK